MQILIRKYKIQFYLILFCMLFTYATKAQIESELNLKNDQCYICHLEEELLPEEFNIEDIHLRAGLSCSGCHGGDPNLEDMDDAMSPEKGFVGIPSKNEIPEFCGKCHSNINIMRKYQPRIPTDQVKQYYTSVHGQKLMSGDTKVADCIDCHTSHNILSSNDPLSKVYDLNVPKTCNNCHGDEDYMSEYNIPTNQFKKYAVSVHGKALLEDQDTGAPACNDCHGNHGATPPGISSISHVCGTCHVNNMRYFSSSKMGKVFEEDELHACEECHGNHEVLKTHDGMVSTGEGSVCINCHDSGDKGYQVASIINDLLLKVVSAYDSALVKQKQVHKIGMDDVDISFLLQEGHQSLIQTRTLVHTFDIEQIKNKTSESLEKIQEARQLAEHQIDEFNVRRKGFGVATIFITVLVIALFFKIRKSER